MTASLTDRYVAATVRGLDEAQRPEVERELRATIEDMVDARLEAGAPTRADAERAVLVELGDPVRLAAGYSGRPLHLIGPGVYPEWLPPRAGAARRRRADLGGRQPRGAALRRGRGDDGRRLARRQQHRAGAHGGPPRRVLDDPRLRHPRAHGARVPRHVDAGAAARHERHGPGRLRRDRGNRGLPRPRGPRARVAADQLAGDQRRRVRPGARPRALVGLDPVAARSCSLAQTRSSPSLVFRRGRWTTGLALAHVAARPRLRRAAAPAAARPAACSTRRSSRCWSRVAGPTPSATSTCRRPSASSSCSSGASSRRGLRNAPGRGDRSGARRLRRRARPRPRGTSPCAGRRRRGWWRGTSAPCCGTAS